MKKTFALITSAVLLLTATACGGSDNQKLSNPVAVDDEGKVDMEVALSYQTDIDKFLADLDEKEVDPNIPVSANASEKTKKVFNFLRENYGKNMIVAQQMRDEKQEEDFLYYHITEDLPAIKGFDMIFVTGSYINTAQTQAAIDWHTKSGGLVTYTWHWNVPRDIDNPSQGHAFYTEDIINFSLSNAVTPGTKEYEVIVRDIDTIAIELQKLEAANVPVLWRPLHEASGSWFWWGLQDRDDAQQQLYQKLWYIVYDRLENYHKLTNLIWVWNGQSKRMTVHPNTYDISGIDVYPQTQDHSPQQQSYDALASYTEEGKMLALTECGYIPDPDEVFASSAKWLYYMPWNGDFIYNATVTGAMIRDLYGKPSVNKDRLSQEFLENLFKHDKVITWSDLPDWGDTKKEIPEHINTWLIMSTPF